MAKLKHGTTLNRLKPKLKGSKKLAYIRFSAGPLRGQYVHRVIVEAMIGRKLTPNETVDHVNGNTLDDTPSNLEVVSWAEHGRRTRAREKEKQNENVDESNSVSVSRFDRLSN